MGGGGHFYCQSIVIQSDVRKVEVIVIVQALSYCLVYGRCGLLLLSKLCHNPIYIGDRGHWFCPKVVILLGVLKVGVIVTFQAMSYNLM